MKKHAQMRRRPTRRCRRERDGGIPHRFERGDCLAKRCRVAVEAKGEDVEPPPREVASRQEAVALPHRRLAHPVFVVALPVRVVGGEVGDDYKA